MLADTCYFKMLPGIQRDNRRSLGEPVALDKIYPELVIDPEDACGKRTAAGYGDAEG